MCMTLKVKFKPEVLKQLRSNPDFKSGSFVRIKDSNISYGYQSYDHRFDVPFFIVTGFSSESSYRIVEPRGLSTYAISKAHVMPYNEYEITLDDELFEL